MQKAITVLFAIILFGGGILFAYSLVQKGNQPVIVQNHSQDLPKSIVTDELQENDLEKEEETKQQEIPEELKEQLSVSDIVVRDTSIANNPDIWRAFINSEIGHSDPSFVFGCEEYLDTGGQLIKDLFIDQANQVWVADVAGGELIGIGQLNVNEYALIAQYLTVDKEIACLELSNAVYANYQLLSSRVELITFAQEQDGFFYTYDLTVLVNNTYLTLPASVISELDNYTGAGRTPVLVANRFIIGYGEFGINAFDLQTWQLIKLFGMHYDGIRGMSEIYTYKDEPLVAFAHENWEGDPAFGAVYVYDLSAGKNYIQYMRNAELGWMMGSNEIFSLENSSDIEFLDAETLRIVEYPNFNEDITNGDDPYLGETETLDWMFLQK